MRCREAATSSIGGRRTWPASSATTDAELVTVAEIARAHPGWIQGQLNEAAPFIIAHAKAEKSIIVSEENRKGPNTEDKNQKIPNIAYAHKIQTIKFFDYVRQNGWQF